MVDDSWKGEHLIHVKPAGHRHEGARIANKIYHAKRRKMGLPAAGAAKHATLVKAALFGSRKRGPDA